MRIIISDSSCLIDLHKGGLLEAIFSLPYQFSVPQPLFDRELLSLSKKEKQSLVNLGMTVSVLSGEQMAQAQRYYNEHLKLHLHDCCALTLSEEIDDAILLTGDALLRTVATDKQVEVRGVLWLIDRLAEQSQINMQTLVDALTIFRDDELVWLPDNEIKKRINRLNKVK